MRPGPDHTVSFRGTYRETAWQRIQTMVAPEGIVWNMWDRDDYPHWSLPALEAAKCAALQGNDAFDAMHFLLFRGFFELGVNIADHEEVRILAQQAPLDYARFVDDYESGLTRRAVLDEYEDAVNDHMIYAIPTVIFPDGDRIVGAVSIDEYAKALEKYGLV